MKSSSLARCAFAVATLGLLVSCGDSSGPGGFAPFIVFASDRTNPTTLFRMNLDGTNVQQLIADESYFGAVDNSGTLLAYGNQSELFLKNLSSGSVTALAPFAATNYRPVLDRDGTRVAFVSDRNGGDREIWIVNTSGTGLTRLTNRVGEDSYPAFSPDGQRIVFMSRIGLTGQIFIMNADGTGLTNLSNSLSDDATPCFFPDGSKILFSSNRGGDYDIYTMNPDGSGQTLLFHRDGREFMASLTPDGTRVVFHGTNLVAGPTQIYIANVNGTGMTNLSSNNVTETRTAGIIPGGS